MQFTDEEKRFYAVTAREAAGISKTPEKEGAVLVVHKGSLVSVGCAREIISGKPWIVSAVYDAIFKARDMDISGSSVFCSRFPSLNDLVLLVATGVSRVYFVGDIKGKEAVEFLNALSEVGLSIDVIKLEIT